MTRKKDIFEAGKALVEFYRANPVIAAYDLLNVDLSVPQRRILEDMWFKKHIIVTAGRGVGKTYISATFACLYALLYPGQKVGLLAPSFRQSKLIFSEVEKIWSVAPILQEATSTKPVKAADRCYLQFNQAGNRPPSLIESVPLGDGGKIRGARYYAIIADEFAQIPVEIFNTVIMPMGATAANPMERVRRLEKEKIIRERGGTVESFDDVSNKIIMTSSAYYQFNHMYARIKTYQEMIDKGEKDYAVHNISYKQLPDGFLSEDNIKNAKATLTNDQFRMEYEAGWVSDSAGIFKASLIEQCRAMANHSIKFGSDAGKEYVLGVDPARTKDAFAICVIELGVPNKVVAAFEFRQMDFPAMAKTIMDLTKTYETVVAIHMDAGGGGLAIKDLLAEEARFPGRRILDANDEELFHQDGRKILHLANFNPRFIADANYNTLNLMEKGGLTLPKAPQYFAEYVTSPKKLEEAEDYYEIVQKMIEQCMAIEVTESRAGVAHFSLPEGADGHGKNKKDLYTAFILAGKMAYDLQVPTEDFSWSGGSLGIIEPINTSNFIIPSRGNSSSSRPGRGVVTAPVINSLFNKNFNKP